MEGELVTWAAGRISFRERKGGGGLGKAMGDMTSNPKRSHGRLPRILWLTRSKQDL